MTDLLIDRYNDPIQELSPTGFPIGLDTLMFPDISVERPLKAALEQREMSSPAPRSLIITQGWRDDKSFLWLAAEVAGGKNMEHLHKSFWLDAGDTVEISLDTRANVMLMDASNYSSYQYGNSFNYYGGQALRSPIRLSAPYSGQWNVVIDLGGGSGYIRHSIRVLSGRN